MTTEAGRAHQALLALVLLSVPAVGSAGGAARRPPASVASRPDVFLGYSYTKAGDASLHGLALSGSYPLGGSLGLALDLSGHDGSFAGADLGQIGLMAGVRWSPSSGRLRPFAEGLLGGARTSVSVDVGGTRVSDADSDWGLAFGGGVDYGLGARWGLRGLVHLRLVHGEGAWDSDPRFAVGALYRFGR
jgi:hypothetical protein